MELEKDSLVKELTVKGLLIGDSLERHTLMRHLWWPPTILCILHRGEWLVDGVRKDSLGKGLMMSHTLGEALMVTSNQ